MGLPLAPSDEPNRYCIQLYHRTATQADLSGKKCWRPAAATAVEPPTVRTLRPASYTGLDYNPDGVAFAQKGTTCRGWISCTATPRACPFPMSPSTR